MDRGEQLVNVLRRKFSVLNSRARLRNLAPTIVILILFSHAAWAGFDLHIGAATRSYPLSGVVQAESGYGILLRGTAHSPFSSYLRLKIDGASAGTYNSLGAAFEFFPLAILGLRAGGEAIQNDNEYTAYDCAAHQCLGRNYRTYIEGELTLGAGPVFVQGRWRRERWSQKDPLQGDFIDPTSGVVLKSEGDSQTVYYGVAGIKFGPKWSVLGVVRYAESDLLKGWSRLPYGVLMFKEGTFSAGVGAGVFASSLKDKDFSALGFLRWEIAPSLAVR